MELFFQSTYCVLSTGRRATCLAALGLLYCDSQHPRAPLANQSLVRSHSHGPWSVLDLALALRL